jgi:uncharacterized membrane protein YccF (DUF307 family)
VAALYDGILGAGFFIFYNPLFHALGIALPNNTSYIHITTAYIFVQGVSYWFVYRDPLRNVDIVKVGIVYKIIYVVLAAYYLAIGQLLSSVFAWLAVTDLIFLVFFVRFVMQARQTARAR